MGAKRGMRLVPDFRLSLALYREEDRLRDGMVAQLHRMRPTLRILGTLGFFRMGCRMMPLVQFLERFGDEDATWLLASLMAKVNESYWEGWAQGWPAQVAQRWEMWHVGAPGFREGRDGAVLAYWVNVSRDKMPGLRRYWFHHLLATASMEDCPAWMVTTPFGLRKAMELGAH